MPPDPRSAKLVANIGRYRILGVLGEGGMGIVYEAEHDKPNRIVALKVIRPDFVSAELLRRFALESEVLGRLQHPGIAQIYEAGTAEGPHGAQSFFAMELVRGESLMDYVNGQALSLPDRLSLFARICDAVHYAHQQGVIHRDLKPANILVDTSGNPKILDFGVARVTDADLQGTRQTSVGEMIGTLMYMSPEQIDADPLALDARSDVYALGVLLYELVSGRLPYDLEKKALYEAARVIQMQEPAPLSSINRKWRGDIEIIVARALAKEADRRYASADALASDLRRFLNDEPIVARPASAWYQLRKFARRNQPLVIGLSATAAVLVAGTTISAWQAVRATAAERLAEARRVDAETATALAEQRRGEAEVATQLAELRLALADSALRVADAARADALREQRAATASALRAQAEATKSQAISSFLQNMLASAEPQNTLGEVLTVRRLLDRTAEGMAEGELTKQPEVRAEVEATIGRTYYGLGVFDQARTHLDSAYAIQRRLPGPTRLALGRSAAELGRVAFSAGDNDVADRHLVEALDVLERSGARTDDITTDAMADLGSVRYMQGRNEESEALYRAALQRTTERHGPTSVITADRLISLGRHLAYTQRAAEAMPLLERAVEIFTTTYGEVHPQVVEALTAVSDALERRQDYVAAETTLRRALPTARTLFGSAHPSLANVVSRLGSMLRFQQRLEDAEPFLREGLAMRITLLGPDHPDVQLARTDLARAHQALGDYASADSLYSAALQSRRTMLGETSPAVASSLTDLGMLGLAREDWSAAQSRFEAAFPIWRDAGIEDQELFVMAQLGTVLQRQDKLDAADSLLAQTLSRRRARFGDAHWSVGDSHERLASVAAARNQFAQAESLAVIGLETRRAVYGPRSFQAATQLQPVANYRQLQGDTARAIAPLRESLALLAEIRPPTDSYVLSGQRLLATALCASGAETEGETLIRTAQSHVPDDMTRPERYRVDGVLGFCLMRRRRYAEAEPVLLRAESGLRSLSTPSANEQRTAVVTLLIRLYDQWGKAEQVALWKQR